jgi:DNA-binding NarL/FixJ family response regulator
MLTRHPSPQHEQQRVLGQILQSNAEKISMNVQLQHCQSARRRQAVASNLVAVERVSLAKIWQELCLGKTRFVDAFFTMDRCYAVLTAPSDAQGPLLNDRRLTILHGLLCGQGQKRVGIELELSASTVAADARLALEALGLTGKPSRVHPMIMASAMSFYREEVELHGWHSRLNDGASSEQVVSIARPEHALRDALPPAELAVMAWLVEGLPYTNMARMRGTAMRTIANQIAAVFRRLKVSGRNELLQWLFEHQAAEDALPVPPLPPIPPASAPARLLPPSAPVTETQMPELRLYA